MASEFKRGESPRKGLRRIVRGQIDDAIEELKGVAPAEEMVHDVRKRLKRLRALLRLARDGMDEATYERESARFRDAGRPLSEVRDTAALVDAFGKLIDRTGDGGHTAEVAAVRAALRAHKDDASRHVLGDAAILDDLSDQISKPRDALGGRAFSGVRWPTLREGLRRIYRQGRRAFHAAVEAPTDENLHEWRKRVKDLGYALGVVEPIRPRFTGRWIKLSDELADLLGDDHDLVVLRRALLDGTMPAASAVALVPKVDERRGELQGGAFALGRKAYRDRPATLAERLDASWHAWRSRVAAD